MCSHWSGTNGLWVCCMLQLKSFHNELLTELEKKVELDARYLNVGVAFVLHN